MPSAKTLDNSILCNKEICSLCPLKDKPILKLLKSNILLTEENQKLINELIKQKIK